MFSDKKKFNVDGQNDFTYYWDDLQHAPRYFSTGQQIGQSVVIWGAIPCHDLSDLAVVKGNMNSQSYCSVLENHLLPFAAIIFGTNGTFQNNIAATHRSVCMKNRLKLKMWGLWTGQPSLRISTFLKNYGGILQEPFIVTIVNSTTFKT